MDWDVVIVEIGGTVGALSRCRFWKPHRQMRLNSAQKSLNFVHVTGTVVPLTSTAAGEQKTKPTQHSVKRDVGIGIQPDILLCRSDRHIPSELKRKIALFCNVAEAA